MNGSSAQIAVVKARLPYVDRRVLSQAWFSALGYAEQSPDGARRSAKRAASIAGSPARAFGTKTTSLSACLTRACLPISRGEVGSRHTLRSLATILEPAMRLREARPVATRTAVRYPPVRASFRLDLDGGRVQIVVRRDGCILHVVALCSRKHVALVQRALACAALHLGARGESLRSDVRAVEPDGAA